MKKKTLWKSMVSLTMTAALLFSATAVYVQAQPAVVQPQNIWKNYGQSADLTISSARELNEFAQKVNSGNDYAGKVIKLTQDIEYDGVTVNNFTTIAEDISNPFRGTFDGCGYTISGIIVISTRRCAGLFGVIRSGGTVKNVTVKDSDFTGSGYVAAIVGRNYNGVVENCHNRNVNIDNGIEVGGIVGSNEGKVVNCSSTGDVISGANHSTDSLIGGVVGENYGDVINCCNLGNVSSNKMNSLVYVGGVVGLCYDGSLIQNCYNAGIVTGDFAYAGWGGIAGKANQYGSIIANSFCSEESAHVNIGIMNGIERNNKALPAEEMQTEEFAAQLNANRGSNTSWLEWEIRPEESKYPLHVKMVDISQWQISSKSDVFTYDGTAKRPDIVAAYNGKTMSNGVDYQLSYRNNINAGTGTVIVEGIGRYTGSAELTFTIKKAEQKFNYTKSYKKAYGDAAFTPVVKSTGNGKLSYSSSDKKIVSVDSKGMVTIKGTGIATITVSAGETSNYKAASVKLTVKVAPKKQTAKIKTRKARKMTVNWTKDSKATGYEIQYGASKKLMKSAKPINIKKNTTVKKTITKLVKGKKYYVRVRSYKKVGSEILYGAWSATAQSAKM